MIKELEIPQPISVKVDPVKTISLFINFNYVVELSKSVKVVAEKQIIYTKYPHEDLHNNKNKWSVDCIETMDYVIYYEGKKLDKNYNDENCSYKKYLAFSKSIGVDIIEIVELSFDNWEKKMFEQGYFYELLKNYIQ